MCSSVKKFARIRKEAERWMFYVRGCMCVWENGKNSK